MKQSDKNRFASAFQSMCEILDKKSTTIMISGYFTALENFSIEQTEKAISKAIGSCKFFPKPVELIEIITGGQKQLANNAEIEVDKILCHFRQYGSSKHPEINDPITKHLMTGRWPWASWSCEVLSYEFVWFKKEFITAYNAYSDSDLQIFQNEIECNGEVRKLIATIGGCP